MTRMDIVRADYKNRLMNQLVKCYKSLGAINTKQEENRLYLLWKNITDSLKRDLKMSLHEIDTELRERLASGDDEIS